MTMDNVRRLFKGLEKDPELRTRLYKADGQAGRDVVLRETGLYFSDADSTRWWTCSTSNARPGRGGTLFRIPQLVGIPAPDVTPCPKRHCPNAPCARSTGPSVLPHRQGQGAGRMPVAAPARPDRPGP
jgi:hypothetical protein